MKEIVSDDNPCYRKSTKNLVIKNICIIQAILLLASSGCGSNKVEDSFLSAFDLAGDTQSTGIKDTTEQASISDTPAPSSSPRATSLDLGNMMPQTSSAPYVIQYINDEEMNELARNLLNDSYKNLSPNATIRFNNTDKELVEVIKMLFGNFSIIKQYYKSSGYSSALDAKKYYYIIEMNNFYNDSYGL